MIKKILGIVILVAVLAVVIVTMVWARNPTDDIQRMRLYFDAYRTIGIGFLVALLGTIIPNLILESRDNFERARDSRDAYSQAKTSVLYLPGTLAVLSYGEAMDALQAAHQKMHKAETYEKELVKYLTSWYDGGKKTWTDQNYWELTAVRRLLQSLANEWKTMGIGDRTIEIDAAQEKIRDLFGPGGIDWNGKSKGKREDEAKDKVKEIVTAAVHHHAKRHS